MIGIFDSGIGGLTVVKEIKKQFPDKKIIYFGDTARVPWGNKSKDVVKRYSSEICDFLISKGCKKIIIACNTASALASSFLRKKFKNIEIIDVVKPTVQKIKNNVAENKNEIHIGVVGTRATINSGIYEKEIKRNLKKVKVFSLACPLFVPLIEENWLEKKIVDEIIASYLMPLKRQKINVLILGCTHYPMLQKSIEKFFGSQTRVISSARAVAEYLDLICDKKGNTEIIQEKSADEYYFSDWTEHYEILSKAILGKKIRKKIIKI